MVLHCSGLAAPSLVVAVERKEVEGAQGCRYYRDESEIKVSMHGKVDLRTLLNLNKSAWD